MSRLRQIARRCIRGRVDSEAERIASYIKNGGIPWSLGYEQFRWRLIDESVRKVLECDEHSPFSPPAAYGIGVDERCVEYPWVFNHLKKSKGRLLDAGSTLNQKRLIDRSIADRFQISFVNLAIENTCLFPLPVSYVLGDLCDLPFQNNWFDVSTCISVLEHIGMDNSIYGHSHSENKITEKQWSWTSAVNELIRVTKPDGRILITVPVGCFMNYGFFQQFDSEMVQELERLLGQHGTVFSRFFRYQGTGWAECNSHSWQDAVSFNPHTGVGKGEDGAAHCRAIGCFVTN